MNIISVKNLSKDFGQERVLKSVTRDFEKGKIHGIVGNNGSGKTVLMKCICGFLIPTEGTVTVNGKRVGRDVDFPPDLGVIIETPGFLPGVTGVKNLEILASLNKKIGLSEIADAIRCVGLDPFMKKPVGKYSLGMRQRLGIAQAIMNNKSAKARSGLLPFPVIAAAVNGNVDAIHSVLKHYEGYIAALSMRKLYDEKGCSHWCVDEEMRRRLETKLITRILTFRLTA